MIPLIIDSCSKNIVSISTAPVSARPLRDQSEVVYRPLQFQKRSQNFIGAHDETVSVATCVCTPDRSPFAIDD